MSPEAMPNTAAALIDTLIASNRGDQDAFVYNDKRYSYQDVAALMNRAGSMVKELGVGAGGRVLLLLPASPSLAGSLLGSIKAGAVPVVGVPSDSEALAQCVATARPSAAIVHESRLPAIETALAAIPRDAIVVAGADVHGYRSFVHEMRGQPSWFAAQDINGDAPALGCWTGCGVDVMSHAELAAFINGSGSLGGASGAASGEIALVGAILRAFAKGEAAALA